MKTLTEIKDEIARKYGYGNWEQFDDLLTFGRQDDTDNVILMIDEIAIAYHKQCTTFIQVENIETGDKYKYGRVKVIGNLRIEAKIKPDVSGCADIFKTILIPADINWVDGLQRMDGSDLVTISVDGEEYTIPKKIVYLVDKLSCNSDMWKRQSEMNRKLLLKIQENDKK